MLIRSLGSFLKKIDYYRDRALFPLIRKYWPRVITPNHLTILRIILAVLLSVLLFSGFTDRVWIVPLFCLAISLDLLDGSVARALNKETKIGAIIDSVADKILILPIAVFSLYRYYKWLLFFLLLPEIIVALVASYYRLKKKITEPNIFGKTKMVLESVAFAFVLLSFPGSPYQFSIILLYLAIVFAFLSCFLKTVNSQK